MLLNPSLGQTGILLIPPPLGANTLLIVHQIRALAGLNPRHPPPRPGGRGAVVSID